MNTALKRILGLQSGIVAKEVINKQSSNFSTYKNVFKHSGFMIPHPEKAHKGGEDAKFHNEKCLTVCDGVGGWANHGVDPGLYSKALAKHMGKLFEENEIKYIQNPKKLIADAHQLTKEIGSTTVCTVTIDDIEENNLRASYIGDSGYIIYRKNSLNNTYQTVYVSDEQQKGFNFPYQIGSEGDSPSKSLCFEHTVEHNDLIVVGTDGLFDNINEKQILQCIQPLWEAHDSIQDLDLVAELISKFAYKLSLDPTYYSPFAQKARKSFYDFAGGKSDDITVVVGQVKLNGKE